MRFPFDKIIKVLVAVPKAVAAITKLIKLIKGNGNGGKEEEKK